MHFATPQDSSVMVPAKGVLESDYAIENILGWDYKVGRIRSWGRAEDRPTLERGTDYLRLYNPRPFAEGDIVLEPEGAIVIVDDDEDGEAAAPAPAKRRRATLAEVGRGSSARDWDPRKHRGPGGLESSANDVGALLTELAESMAHM
jgi:hypothetical protein